MKYRIAYAEVFDAKTLRSLPPPILRKIKKAIEQKLVSAPEIFGKPLRQSLKGFWTLRVQDYRVVYRMQKQVVEIYAIRHRSIVYKWLLKELESMS